MIKLVSDLQQVGGFPPVLRIPPPIILTATIYNKHHNSNPNPSIEFEELPVLIEDFKNCQY